jgi:hypothetical protein
VATPRAGIVYWNRRPTHRTDIALALVAELAAINTIDPSSRAPDRGLIYGCATTQGDECQYSDLTERFHGNVITPAGQYVKIIIIFSKLCRFGGPTTELGGCMWLHLLVVCGCIVSGNVK